ncbi:MAG: hypothetical protein QOJ91_2819 [Sphingomonadales bacterium]|jgi:hypothetical protein|nr:hypothetical protein [Sphingomonadales bacterium]
MLILNGLRIATTDGGEPADLVWHTDRVDSLPPEPAAGDPIAIVRGERTEAGDATDHIFGYDGRVRCRFRIAPDGSAIRCRAIPGVSDRDLFSLFAEPVMRTILVRRGLLSFHAAALSRNDRAVLIMADKGAGKSTLSWALQSQGWELLADDLARVDSLDGRWSVFPGHRQTKLTPAAARAFGHGAQDMPVRFDDPGPAASAAQFDKRVIDPVEALADPSAPVALAACFFLTARDPSAAAARIERLAAPAAVRRLLDHATPDPLGNAPAAPPALQRAIGRLASEVKAAMLTLPDRFDGLAEATAAVEASV